MWRDSIFYLCLVVAGGSAVARILLKSRREAEENRRQEIVTRALNANLSTGDAKRLDELATFLRGSMDLLAVSSPASSPNASALMFNTEIVTLRNQLAHLRQQVIESKNEIIEIQKIDPVLEATLKVTLENVVRRVELLEKQSLTKWDVALIVAQILGTLGLLLGLTFGIIKYLHP